MKNREMPETVLDAGRSAQIADRLLRMGLSVRAHLLHARDVADDATPLGYMGGDMVYAIDKKVEPIVGAALAQWSQEDRQPLVAIAEGFGVDGSVVFGQGYPGPGLRLLIDPIDGTRCLMYDKRSAWFLAAAAPDRGPSTRLAEAVASVMVEIPTSKQGRADHVVFSAGNALQACRVDLVSGQTQVLHPRTSDAGSLLHGYGQVSNFFPGTKELASSLMERIAEVTPQAAAAGMAGIFDDQYTSTGGQLVELMFGRDRFCCDLRPIFYDILERRSAHPVPRGICVHPYDIAGLPAAIAGGVIVTDAFGAPLDADFSVESPVHWCGYANAALQRSIEPVIRAWIAEHLGR